MNVFKLKKVVCVMGMVLSGPVMAYGVTPVNPGVPGVPGGGLVLDIEEERRLVAIASNTEGVFTNSKGLKVNRVALEGLNELLPPIPENRTEPLALTFCSNTDEIQWGDCPTYKLGGRGPAGGWVFYVSDSGMRGLEASPEDQGNYEWGCYNTEFEGVTGTAIGSGAANTKIISESNCVGRYSYSGEIAARVSNNYELNGFDDWYLPSRDELYLMDKNLNAKGLGDFKGRSYWSSSNYTKSSRPDEFAWIQYFGGGNYGVSRFGELPVRSIRSF